MYSYGKYMTHSHVLSRKKMDVVSGGVAVIFSLSSSRSPNPTITYVFLCWLSVLVSDEKDALYTSTAR